MASALAFSPLLILITLYPVEPVITFPKSGETLGGDVLLPTDASLLLGLKSLENVAEQNAVISPANLYACLWLLYSGARGDTKAELAHVLGSIGSEPITTQLNALQDVYTANAAFVDVSSTVKYEYASAPDRNVFSVDFGDDDVTRQSINGWVSEHTRGTITNLLDTPLDSTTKAVVISALYFNATWLYPFDPQFTKSGKFEWSPSKYTEVPMMISHGNYPLYRGPSYDAVGLPYADNNFTLYILLPHPTGSRALKSLVHHLSPEEINHMSSAAEKTSLIVSIPKFTANTRTQLRPVLQSLGVNKIFNPQFADFGDLIEEKTEPNLFVSEVVQSVHLEVDEKGTRGGAATAALLTKSGKTTFQANRPFVYLLRHDAGHVLFLGVFTVPSQQ